MMIVVCLWGQALPRVKGARFGLVSPLGCGVVIGLRLVAHAGVIEAAAQNGGGFIGKVNVWRVEAGLVVAPDAAILPGGVRSAVQ